MRAPDAIVSELRREARWRMVAASTAACAAFAVFVAGARQRSPSAQDWSIALALGVVALASAIASSSRRRAVLVVATAPLVVLASALVTDGRGPLQPAQGVECVATELACGAAVVCGTWLALRRGTSALGARAAAANAAAGAVGGAAALQLTCPSHAALSHVVSFHVTGVVLAAAATAAAWCLGRRARGA
jgi:hypothetical protein